MCRKKKSRRTDENFRDCDSSWCSSSSELDSLTNRGMTTDGAELDETFDAISLTESNIIYCESIKNISK